MEDFPSKHDVVNEFMVSSEVVSLITLKIVVSNEEPSRFGITYLTSGFKMNRYSVVLNYHSYST